MISHKNIYFGNRILIFVSLLLILTVLLTVYLMRIIHNNELSLLEHQKARLKQVAYIFDQSVGGSINDYLIEHGMAEKNEKEKILFLENYINPLINSIKEEYPEVHIGLYYADPDAGMDVYLDGSRALKENYSLRREKAFQTVLSGGSPLEQNLGEQESGVLEFYTPFFRNGKVEGVIRSAEYLNETGFYSQRREIESTVYAVIVLVVVTGIAGSVLIFRQLVTQVDNIKKGVKLLGKDLSRTLSPAPGELGEIVSAINGFAHKIADLNVYNETMLGSIDDAILVVDVGGRIMIANNMARKLLHLSQEALGQDFRLLLGPASPFTELVNRSLTNKESLKDLNVSYVNGNHNLLQLVVSTSTLTRPDGAFIGVALLCRDITERMRLREKAQRQERLASLGKLVTGVAHEIRNPLTAISCYIQHWQSQHTPNPAALATMHREVARLDALVDQLLYFAKPAEAQFVYRNINSLIEEVVGFFNEVHHGKYNMVTNLDHDIPRAWMDPEQIERVLVNILFNALQAMPEGGTIFVSTGYATEPKQVYVSVADTGCGIPKEHLAHLFDPFFSGRSKGTGLGLAIAHEIILGHEGNIEVESEVGKGTKFTFYLNTRGDV